jgi:hypothetical protein
MYSFSDADELTVVRPEGRRSSSPPPRFPTSMPPLPRLPALPRDVAPYDDDEPTTMLHPSSSRPLLSMSSRNVMVAADSRGRIEEPPKSVAAVDASASGVVRDLSMTSSLSSSTDLRRMRGHGPAWGVGLVAVGLLAGVVMAFIARGDGLAAAAALVDPSHEHEVVSVVSADVVKAVQQVPAAQAVAQAQQPVAKPAAPSCNADAVMPPVAKVEAVVVDKVQASKPADLPKVATYVAPVPRATVRHVEHEPTQVAVVPVATAVPVAPKVTKVARHTSADDMQSASAADALAKAQLDAALTR